MARESAGSSSLDGELRRLYRLPLGEFTAARNALAKELQKKGDAKAADQVKALAKPSVSAWAVNQLFAREADRMQSLIAAGERARKAMQHTLTVGEAEALRDALQEQREQRNALRDSAAGILAEDLRAPGQAILDRVTVNLDALALSPGAAGEAERGWLRDDLEPPGFEVLSGLQFAAQPDRRGLRLVPPPAAKKPAEEEKVAKVTPEEERRRIRIEKAQEKADLLAAAAETVRRDAEKAERDAAEAERAAQEAARRAESAREDAERIRRWAERAAADAERAEKDLEAARRLS